mmetsp:Transcript_23457/g.70313  ORF Transcript_23457/g.70313 Transcript_23457/m.70313 type:complete len:231 (+) Transcript_23457:146-838(+)
MRASLLLFAPALALRCRTLPRTRRPSPARRAPRMMFLEEAPYKDDALIWAKETSRTQRAPMHCVVALYDDQKTCVYVGAFGDSALAVAALCRKHGRGAVNGLRYEQFQVPLSEADASDLKMRAFLEEAWLEEATQANGFAPVGNADGDWAAFDETSNPFLAGFLGAEGEGIAALLTPEELAEEKLQQRRENMKKNLDDAVLAGDEALATKLLRRLQKLDDGEDDDEEDDA